MSDPILESFLAKHEKLASNMIGEASGMWVIAAEGGMIKMRAAVSGSAPFANAGPVGIAMKQYEQDPNPERLRQVRTLIERVNARKGRSAQ